MVVSNVEKTPATVDEAFHRAVSDALAGPCVGGVKEPSHEVLHYRTGMNNPRRRIVAHPSKALNVVGAIARFVWMVAGSNRLEDIAFYESKVRLYTDDDLTVPGSSYGKRLFDAAPGLDQIRGVIERLRENSATRQAAAVVWVPEDAVRKSRDIPCTFGMFFHVRNEQLTMCTIMRSNNAVRLLPFNFFEFSLLGEVVAATLDLPLGQYVHIAASMHVIECEMEVARQISEAGPGWSIEMPPMPGTDQGRLAAAVSAANDRGRDLATAIGQASELARLEAQLRHAYTEADFADVRTRASEHLNEYWLGFFNVLAAWGAHKRGWPDTTTELLNALPEYLHAAVSGKFAEVIQTFGTDLEPPTLFEIAEEIPAINPVSSAAAESQQKSAEAAAFEALASYFARGHTLDIARVADLVSFLTVDDVALAARSETRSAGTPADRYPFSDEMIRAAIDRLP